MAADPLRPTTPGDTDPRPPHRSAPLVDRLLRQTWDDVTFLHWAVDPEQVTRRLPVGLEADTIDGAAWVSLVPFQMRRIGLRRGPGIPYLGTFPETNVRTYVRGPGGAPGVWFDSLDATRLLPVVTARLAYGLPYMWSKMSIVRTQDRISYRARRRWPAPAGAESRVEIAIGSAIDPSDRLAAFLTSRWRLFSARGASVWKAEVEHPVWPMHEARLRVLDDQFVAAAGYDVAGRPPDLVHYAPGVPVLAGRPRRVG